MEIQGLQRTTVVEFPERIATVVFTPGCNFRCPYCYNKDLVEGNLPEISEEKALKLIEERKKVIDGVMLTGGEITLQDGLQDFIKKIKEIDDDLEIGLESNGTKPEKLGKLIEDIDYIAMDIKAPLDEYKKTAGVEADSEKIRESIKLIKESGVEHEFRTTVVPGLIGKEDIKKITELIPGEKNYYLQKFRPKNTLDPEFENKRSPTDKEMQDLKAVAEENVKHCKIRG